MGSQRRIFQLVFMLCVGFIAVRILILTIDYTERDGSHKIGPSEAPSHGVNMASIVSGMKTSNAVVVPFDPVNPRKVVVMTYQRCGSSFFGQLFNMNPNVFYMYEPLDSLYSALYGVREGWNVPSDITTYWNGTERVIPEKEKRAVASFLEHLLSCHVAALPTETLIHRFWFLFAYFHESLNGYTKCLRTNNLKYTRCDKFTPAICGNRFGQFSDQRIDECNQLLWNKDVRERHDDAMARNITQYRTCMDNIRAVVDEKCSGFFRRKCEKAELRTTKTVRATMPSMGYLLTSDPNMRVIHLIRDPRAVVLSRRNFDKSARSHYAGGSLVKEAEVYCRDVVRDIKERHLLEKLHPGRIMTVIYDDLTKRPLEYAKEIYRFLNTTLHPKTEKWLIQNTSKKVNSTAIAGKWREKLTYQTARDIMATCEEFFLSVDYMFS